MQQPESRHREERIIGARAGSALIFNRHLWHSGTRNEAGAPRRVLQCQFIAREFFRLAEAGPEISERFTPAARYLFGP